MVGMCDVVGVGGEENLVVFCCLVGYEGCCVVWVVVEYLFDIVVDVEVV